MAALTGSERGLPVGSFLNDTVEAGPDTLQVSVVWQPFEDEASLVKHCCFVVVGVIVVAVVVFVLTKCFFHVSQL